MQRRGASTTEELTSLIETDEFVSQNDINSEIINSALCLSNEKIQLRIIVDTKINYQNNLTKKSWEKTTHMSRQCYLGDKAPGSKASVATSRLTSKIDNLKYNKEESEIGYKNFCVVENFIKSIEWLYLAAKGHRRALFSLKNNSLEKKWLIP